MKLNRKHQKKLEWIQKSIALGVPLATTLAMGSTARAEESPTPTPSEIREPMPGDILLLPGDVQTDSPKEHLRLRKEKIRRTLEQRRIRPTAGVMMPPRPDTPKLEPKKK